MTSARLFDGDNGDPGNIYIYDTHYHQVKLVYSGRYNLAGIIIIRV